MLQVTMDLETQLYQLEQRRLVLIKWRDEIIVKAEEMISEANHDFDSAAVLLGRQINELRERLHKEDAPTPQKKERRPGPVRIPDGLDDEDQEHFRELLAKRKRKQ